MQRGKRRLRSPRTVLNVPVKGMEELILFIGSFHGSESVSKLRVVAEKFPSSFHLCEVRPNGSVGDFIEFLLSSSPVGSHSRSSLT